MSEPNKASTHSSPPEMDQDNDPEIDDEMTLDFSAPDPPTTTIQADNPDETMNEDTQPSPREPAKKDISLRDFISKMDDYAPIIPDAVTSHHLLLSGLNPTTTPLPLQRLLALATQKFIADIAADAYQYSRMRSSNTGAGAPSAAAAAIATGMSGADIGGRGGEAGGAGGKDDKGKGGQHVLGVQRAGFGGGGGGGGARAVLTMEDLGCAVGEYGVNVRRGEFYR